MNSRDPFHHFHWLSLSGVARLLAGGAALLLVSLMTAGCGGDERATPPGAETGGGPADSIFARAAALRDALPAAPTRVLVLRDLSDSYSQQTYSQTAHALYYAKQPFDIYDLAERTLTASDSLVRPPPDSLRDSTLADRLLEPTLGRTASTHDLARTALDSLPRLQRYASVLTTTEYLWKLSDQEAGRMRQYVEAGGGLAVLYRGWHDSLRAAFGAPGQPEPSFRERRARFSFSREVMPGIQGLTLPPQQLSFYDFTPTENAATPFARADSSGRPLAWHTRYGDGHVVYWNNSLLNEKRYRGLINQSLAMVQPRMVRPMANWAAVFLDDFPAPAPEDKLEPIRSEFDLSPADFYARQWYPDMRALAGEFNLAYTSAAVFSYESFVTPPFRFSNWLGSKLQIRERPVHYAPWVSREAARRTEVALHGYNHLPLSLDYWLGEAPMIRSLEVAQQRWKVDVGVEMRPRVYVPPLNEIDSTGVAAVQAAVPSVNVLAGEYEGPRDQGRGREFGMELWANGDGLFTLPRNTSGYRFGNAEQMQTLSLLHTVGAWNHSLRPDAVYESPESAAPDSTAPDSTAPDSTAGPLPEPEPLRWRGSDRTGLYYQFQEWLAFLDEHYPWLRYMNASDAAQTMRRYNRVPVRWTSTGQTVTVQAGEGASEIPLYLTVYSHKGERVSEVSGGSFIASGELAFLNYHVIELNRRAARIRFESTDNTVADAPGQPARRGQAMLAGPAPAP